MRQEYFNLATPAPKRLAMMRAEVAAHTNKYPHCPEHAKPKTWRDVRGTTHKDLSTYIGGLSQGSNDSDSVWYCHTGEQFRGEKFADECLGGPCHTGWFTNADCTTYKDGSGKARGIVGRLTHGRFIAGYWCGDNEERVYYPEVFEDETEAAQMADEHARVFAEHAYQDNARFEAMQDAESDCEEKLLEVQKAFALRHDWRFGGTERVTHAIEELRTAREELRVATTEYERG